MGIHVRAMHRGVAARSPARPATNETGMPHVADENFPVRDAARGLRMTAQAEIRVRLHEHLLIDGAMRRVTGRAAFAQRFVLVHRALALLTMTRGALLVQPRHRQSARGLHHVRAVRVVALDAIHLPFTYGMVLRQVKLGVNIQVARKARLRILARIDDELPAPAADYDVFASRPMARFTTRTAQHLRAFNMKPRVRTGGKDARVIRVAIHTARIADECRAGNFGRRRKFALHGRTGN